MVKAVTTPKVYCEVWNDPIMSVGPNSWISSLIGLAGGQNIFENASGTDYPTASSEEIITENPDVMIYPKSVNTQDFWGTLNDVKQRPGWESINAIQNNRIYVTPEGILTICGPRTVDALEILAQMIHPEIFGEYTGE